MLKLKSMLLLLAAGSMLTFGVCSADDAEKAVAIVNDVPISQAHLDLLVKERTAQGQQDTPEMRKSLLDNLITNEVLAQEAAKKGMDKNEELKLRLDIIKQTLLARTYVQEYAKNNPPSEEALKAEYEKLKSHIGGKKEYRARHILVAKESEARDIIARLKKGAKFDMLAAEKSKDPGSKSSGGDLGWFDADSMVKPFGDAVLKLKKGHYTTTPVQSPYGWHIIKLEDSRLIQPLPFEGIKPGLAQGIQQEQLKQMVENLKAKAKIEVLVTQEKK